MVKQGILQSTLLMTLAFLPFTQAQAIVTEGVASYYGDRFHGRRTASGERFNQHSMTAAHRTLGFGTRVLVTNQVNGQSVEVTINDRGPFHGSRTIDLSKGAAKELGMLGRGVAPVKLAVLSAGERRGASGSRLKTSAAQQLMIDLF